MCIRDRCYSLRKTKGGTFLHFDDFVHFRQLQYFIDVAECLSFTQAARKNHIAQTAMSQNILSIERQLGLKLFNRNRQKVSLTESGKSFYADAKHLLSELEKALERCRQIENGFSGSLRIGFQGMHERKLLPHFLKIFRDNYPNIQVSLIQDSIQQLNLKLEKDMLDVIFTISFEELDTSLYCEKILSREPIYAILPKNHPLAERKKIKRNLLSQDPVIFIKRDGSASTFEDVYKRQELHIGSNTTIFIPRLLAFAQLCVAHC